MSARAASAAAPVFSFPSGEGDKTGVTSTQAVLRGLRGRCPNCGRGHMFRSFLKVADTCSVCGGELFHQRADDFPAYLVILLVGHTVVPLALAIETEYAPALWLQVAFWVPFTALLALALLQPIKGAIVAMQWFGGMHEFARSRGARCGTALATSELAAVPSPQRD
jgi:uncharacterized protein (DUF983 family)